MRPPAYPEIDRRVRVSLILPAWNEAAVIAQAIEEADSALRLIADDYELIVVDDGSNDGTGSRVRELAARNSAIRLIQHPENRGYGAALRAGFAAAEMDLVVFTDSDCQFDLGELDRFVLLAQRYEIVCGYRIDRKDSALRCFYSQVYNQLVRLLLRTGVRDVDCALKMFHRDVIRDLPISGNGFLVNSEILTQARLGGHSLVEVGVSHRPRAGGQSTVSITHIPKVLTSLVRYWWNEVQFPSTAPYQREESERATSPTAFFSTDIKSLFEKGSKLHAGLLIIAAIFLFTNLAYPLIDRDETRYAEIPREMIVSSNWAVPQLNFQTYYDKPPLVYWLCAISYSVFGISETAARLVPALAAFLTIASTMWFGSRMLGSRTGLLAGLVLMLSVGFAFASRYLLLDGVLTLLVSLSLFTTYEAIRQHELKLSWWIFSAVCCGLGFLVKGPLAIVLWLPCVFAFTWLSVLAAKPRWWHYGMFGIIVAAIISPWLVAVSIQSIGFLTEFFVTHNVRRFAGEFHSQPIWFFIPVLLVAGHPWSFLTIPYLKFLSSGSFENRQHRPPAIGFLMLWSAWVLVFFSLSRCKLATYVLPAAPALAIMIGHYLDHILSDAGAFSSHRFARIWSARLATLGTSLAGVSFVAFIHFAAIEYSVSVLMWAILWAVLLVLSLVFFNARFYQEAAWQYSSAYAFVFCVMVMHHCVPAYSRSQTLLGASSTQDVLSISDEVAIATVAHEFSEVPFYLDRTDVLNVKGVDDPALRSLLDQRDHAILVVDHEISLAAIGERLPLRLAMKSVVRRGRAQIIELSSSQRIAQRTEVKTAK